jgi:hypothetical protein
LNGNFGQVFTLDQASMLTQAKTMANTGNDKIEQAKLRDEIWLETSNAETMVDYKIVDGFWLDEDEISTEG